MGLLSWFTDFLDEEASASARAREISESLGEAARWERAPDARAGLGEESRNWARISKSLREMDQ